MRSKQNLSRFYGFSLLGLLTLLLVTGCGQDIPLASETRLNSLESGWTTLQTSGETTCGDGSEYQFFVYPGDVDRVVLFFHGGGVCWDGLSCGENGTGIHQIIPAFHPNRQWGILDVSHPENPFAGYTFLALPYCTSDLHLGDRVTRYSRSETVPGRVGSSFKVRHRGQANVGAVLEWVRQNIPSAEQVVVTGSSAGGMAVPFYAQRIARLYPRARIVGIADDAGAFRSETAVTVEEESWGWPDVMQRHPGWSEFEPVVGVERLSSFAAHAAPNLELYMIDHANDRDQALFLQFAGYDSLDTSQLIRKTRKELSEAGDSYAGFIMGGSEHTVLNRPPFYFSTSGGDRLSEWVADIIAGRPVADIDCLDCSRIDFVYDSSDLRMVEAALKLLDSADRWSHEDSWGRCPDSPDVPLTLRCTVLFAARMTREDNPPPHGAFAAYYAILTAAAEQSAPGADAPLIQFNNDPDRSFGDVRSLLIKIRIRIQTQLKDASAPGHKHGN